MPNELTKYPGSADAQSTQDATEPIIGTRTEYVTPKLFIRSIDRSPKDLLTLQKALQAAESIYYPNQQRLFDIYEEAIRDGHLQGIIQKRIDQILNKTLSFRKGVRTKKKNPKVDEMDAVIKSEVFRDIITQLMLRKMWGLSGMEFEPGEKLNFKEIARKHIKLKSQKITYEQTGIDDGLSYVDVKNIWVVGKHHDFGLLLFAAYYAMLKRGAIGDWASYIELFGSPVMVLTYKGFDTQSQKAAERILDRAGNSLKMAIPEEMKFEMKDGKLSNGDGKLQETFRLAMNQEMSLIILGNTETSASGQHGSEGKSKTHSDQQKEIMKSDMEYIINQLNSDQFITILKSYNLPVDGGYFEYDKEVDIEYLKQFYPIVVALATQLGLPISYAWLYETFGIPEPEDGEDVVQLFPTLGQEPSDDPDTEDGQPAPKPPAKGKPKPKPTPKALSQKQIQAIVKDTIAASFKDFFGQPS